MNKITICYSTHRPETLELTTRIMHEHDVIILEEPVHVDFSEILKGNVEIGLLAGNLSKEWRLQLHSVDREGLQFLHRKGSFFSPGDNLTLHYICGRNVSRKKWEMFCAQSLIYSKIIKNEESLGDDTKFPHTFNELESIAAVKQLSTKTCELLFQQIRTLSSKDAADAVNTYLKRQKMAGR